MTLLEPRSLYLLRQANCTAEQDERITALDPEKAALPQETPALEQRLRRGGRSRGQQVR